MDLLRPRGPNLPGRWTERQPLIILEKEKEKNTNWFLPTVLRGLLFCLYFIVLDIFERRGLDAGFVSLLGLIFFFFLISFFVPLWPLWNSNLSHVRTEAASLLLTR